MTKRKNFLLYLFFSLAMLAWGVWYIQSGEKIEVNKGLGWDGKMYAAIAAEFEDFMTKGTLNGYYYKRSLPSAIVHYAHKIAGIEFSIASVIKAFSILNLALIMGCILLWHRILELKSFSFWNRTVALLSVFGTYAVVKVNFYYPVLTDISALFIATWMLHAYVKGHNWSLFLATAAGTFTFPTLFLTGALLLVFQGNSKVDEEPQWTKYVPWIGSSLFLCFFLYAHFFHHEIERPTTDWWVRPSLIATLIYISFISTSVKWSWLTTGLKQVSRRWLMILTGFFLLVTLVVYRYASVGGLGTIEFISNFVQRSAFSPFGFLVAHVAYYGPVIVLLLLFWKQIKKVVHEQSTGLVMVITLNLFFAINPTSRHLIGALPFFVYLLCLALEKKKLNQWFYGVFAIITLAFSRFWFTINVSPFTGDYLTYPDQRYFMADGQYMSLHSYIIQGIAALVCTTILWLIAGRKQLYS